MEWLKEYKSASRRYHFCQNMNKFFACTFIKHEQLSNWPVRSTASNVCWRLKPHRSIFRTIWLNGLISFRRISCGSLEESCTCFWGKRSHLWRDKPPGSQGKKLDHLSLFPNPCRSTKVFKTSVLCMWHVYVDPHGRLELKVCWNSGCWLVVGYVFDCIALLWFVIWSQ